MQASRQASAENVESKGICLGKLEGDPATQPTYSKLDVGWGTGEARMVVVRARRPVMNVVGAMVFKIYKLVELVVLKQRTRLVLYELQVVVVVVMSCLMMRELS